MLEINKVYNMDCLDGMKLLDDNSIDMILCDLPYGTTNCKWDIIIPFDKLWEQYNRIIKDKGCIALFGKQPFSSLMIISNIVMFRYEIIWQKDRLTNIFNVKKQFGNVHENINIFYKKQPTYNPIKEEGWISKNRKQCVNKIKLGGGNYNEILGTKTIKNNMYESLVYPVSVLKFNREFSHKNKRLHPTQKPVALLEYLIKTYSNENDLILDNCAGSGTTGISCLNLKRNYIMMEKEQKYYDIINKRIDDWHLEQKTIFDLI